MNDDTPFGIEFNTDSVAKTGIIKFVKVTLEEGTMDEEDLVRVDLCDHPLYPALERYVRSNMARRRKGA